ncbi:hypothetical protein [Paractinoplanes rishiriensis]|uniref:Uncharacterized protein n=1 Tax=Paractinoplanes rishiriensis TaxID=1050105 RepID=A0A919JV96_9ACTN|nr:hypothetical protein [Actinoplanes rishiriensis]GIE93904.1 hypothetical protein Ari01nite_13690 [Actinoplanes rishiriensis]
MELNDTARVRQPADPIEHRLATVTDLFTNGSTTYIQRYELRFPTGETRTYPPQAIVGCTRDDDHTALVTAFTTACRALRDACRIAHDYDEQLSTDLIGLLLAIHGTAQTRLGITLDPAHLDPLADTEQVTP